VWHNETAQMRVFLSTCTAPFRRFGLHEELARSLAPLKGAPYVVFHDAYQYLEKRYGLNAIGSVTFSPERKPGAARLLAIRKKIRETKAICVFSEPQFQPRLVKVVMEGTGAGTGVLDPLGAHIPAGEDAWFTLMRNMAKSLRTCLSGDKFGELYTKVPKLSEKCVL